MRIEKIVVSRVRVPIEYAYVSSRRILRAYEKAIIRLYATDGLFGLGEAPGSPLVMNELKRIAAIAVGCDVPMTRPDGHASLFRSFRGKPVAERIAAGGIEMAVLDLLGRSQGKPVSEFLGGASRSNIQMVCELSAGPFPSDVEDGELDAFFSDPENTDRVVEHALEQIEEYGYGALKLKSVGKSVDWDCRAMTSLRRALPSEFKLRLDPNGAYSFEDAVDLCNRLAELDLQWFEDPTATLPGMRALHEAVNSRLATNMCIIDFEDIEEHAGLEAVDVVGIDPFHWAGLVNARAAAEKCRLGQRDVFMHCYFNLGITTAAMLQMASTIPDLSSGMDTIVYLQGTDVTAAGVPRVSRGRLAVPSDAGLGVALDEERLSSLLIEEAVFAYEDAQGPGRRDLVEAFSKGQQ